MIYTASSASIRRTFQVKFRDSSLNGSKGKRTYRLDTKSLPAFTDNFNRANSSSISTGTISWEETRGDWEILSNQLSSSTSASLYPIVTVRANTKNARTRIGLGSSGWGWGVAFWVTDQNNWFSATTDQYSTSSGFYSCPNGGTLSGTTCVKTCTGGGEFIGYTGGTCPANQSVSPDSNCVCNDPGGCGCYSYEVGDYGSCTCYSGAESPSLYQGYCESAGWYTFAGVCWNTARSGVVPPYTYPGSGCTANYNPTYSYDCSYAATFNTSTAYLHRLILRKSVSGVVTTIATSSEINTSETARPTHVNVLASGSTVTITAPMNNSSGTLSMVYNSGIEDSRGVRVGVVLSPTSGGTVASNVDNFEYEPVVV